MKDTMVLYNKNSEIERYDEIDGTDGYREIEVKRNPGSGKRRRRKRRIPLWKRLLTVLLCAVVFGGGSACAFYFTSSALGQTGNADGTSEAEMALAEDTIQTLQAGVSDSTVTTTAASLSYSSGTAEGTMDVSAIAEAGLPAIVSITNISVQEVQSYFNAFGKGTRGSMQLEETTSCGSGILVAQTEEYLFIVTNNHVIADATTLSVSFVDDTTCEAELCGTDEDNDLAVIRVSLSELSEDTLSQISIAALGSSDDLKVGEQVVAIGNALGYGQSVTTGIVSALDRTISTSTGDTETTATYIQTDAAINPGNSGGALLNMSGELIGINTAKLSSTEVEGMGYAIPISRVADLIEELMNQTSEIQEGQLPSQSPAAGQTVPGSTQRRIP